jgi:hypothetical protein
MGQDPGQIRNDIEETRARMGDTAEALGHKADVPGRAREAISDRVESVKSACFWPSSLAVSAACCATCLRRRWPRPAARNAHAPARR